jgi:hypothetical protein
MIRYRFNTIARLFNKTEGEPEAGAQTTGQSEAQLRRERAEEQIAQRVNEAQAKDFATFNEDTGEIHAAPAPATEAAATEAKEPESQPAQEQTEPAPRMLSIVVDGRTIEVEESRILEAGKRTLQKDHAADRRLQEAAQAKRQAEELLRQAQRLSIPDTAQTTPAPSQDAPQQQHAPATQGLDPQALDTYLENKLYMRDAMKAAEKFKADFPEIASDPYLMNMAATMENERLSTAAALGESFGDPYAAYRKHGEAVQAWLQKRTGQAPQPMTDKLERKRTITAVPAVNARAPAPQPPKAQTVSEIIEEERKARMGRQVAKH